jgi:hypothetical protein
MKVAEQESRAASFDTKAGLLLGLGGILIGLSPHHLELFRLLGRLAAAVGAGAAVWSMLPRISAGVVPRELRNKYLSAEPDFTKLRLLDTRILLYERDEKRLTSKVHRMRVAVLFLALAVALLLVGSIVDYVT